MTLNFKIVMVRWHEPPQEPCKENRLRQFMQDLCTRPKHCYCHFKFILLSFLLVYWFFFSSATSSSPSFSLPYLNCYSQAYLLSLSSSPSLSHLDQQQHCDQQPWLHNLVGVPSVIALCYYATERQQLLIKVREYFTDLDDVPVQYFFYCSYTVAE